MPNPSRLMPTPLIDILAIERPSDILFEGIVK